MCVCVCMYTCVYACSCVCINECTYTCVHLCVYVCARTQIAGEKTGKGYYSYETRRAQEDPEALRIVEEARREVGAAVRRFSPHTIIVSL
mgnify:CR=1 FL=1